MSDTTNTDLPTVVLVHGAFADASSWNGVIERLQAKGVRSRPRRTRCAGSPPTPPTSPRSSRRSRAPSSPSAIRTAAR